MQAFEQSPSSVVITDTAGNIEYVNPKFSQFTGYTLEEAIGKSPRILKSGETPRETYEELWETIKSGREWHGEFHNKREWRTVLGIRPYFSHQGSLRSDHSLF